MNNIIKLIDKTLLFTPNLPGKTTSEHASLAVGKGSATCSWEINRAGLCITVSIPEDTNGLIRVPFSDDVFADNSMIWHYGRDYDTPNIRFKKIETIDTGDKFIWFEAVPGEYCFNLK